MHVKKATLPPTGNAVQISDTFFYTALSQIREFFHACYEHTYLLFYLSVLLILI